MSHFGHILGIPHSTDGMLLVIDRAEVGLLRRMLQGTDINPTGADAVDANVWPQADGEGMGESDDSAFRGCIRFGMGFGLQGAGRGNIDNGTAVFSQVRDGMFDR